MLVDRRRPAAAAAVRRRRPSRVLRPRPAGLRLHHQKRSVRNARAASGREHIAHTNALEWAFPPPASSAPAASASDRPAARAARRRRRHRSTCGPAGRPCAVDLRPRQQLRVIAPRSEVIRAILYEDRPCSVHGEWPILPLSVSGRAECTEAVGCETGRERAERTCTRVQGESCCRYRCGLTEVLPIRVHPPHLLQGDNSGWGWVCVVWRSAQMDERSL